MVIASSISGLPIYAPSAAFAPTNSGDVSAIASAYQVVSSTATQLYAGTAYVTSVNDAPISASRAGNAANASLANSAWYDGTGRLISALPDSAAVSAIASSYVESGVSSKQDTLSFAYNTADQISSINGSALGGMDEAAVSGIASAYAESAVSSKADSSALSSYVPYSSLEYNTASAISGINGSALAAGSTYSAGEGIDITNNEISVDYDTNTLDVTGQAVTENVTQQSSSGLFLLPSSVAALLSQQTNTQVTVHIPANMLRDVNYDYSEEPSITFRFTLYATDSTSETNVSLFSTALSWENYDGEYGLIDEQDIVFNLPASVANQWSQSLSSAVAFSICGQRSSMPATSAPVELFGDLSTDPITFTFVDASATKLAVKNPLPSSTSADEGKCLVVNSNGDPEWGTGGKTYTGTDGVVVDNVNDTVGLEAPVDIVAGPGIVIDNPDGNTLRVSTEADAETVLWEQSSYTYGITSVTLSESYKNFDTIKVYTNKGDVILFHPNNSQSVNGITLTHFTDANIWVIPWTFTDDTHFDGAAGKMLYTDSGTVTVKYVGVDNSAPYGRWEQPEKIVGIHRIANN